MDNSKEINNNQVNNNEIKKYLEGERKIRSVKKFIKIIVILLICVPFLSLARMIYNQSSAKPIIYLYPEEETEVSVTLGKPKNITASYPDYETSTKASKENGKQGGWNVVAKPDGTLTDTNTGRKLYALYWEGINRMKVDFSEGFVVRKEDTINFLEEKLAILGLNERESEEFIVYWLPKMQENEYNLVKFASREEIDEDMPLNFSVQPDTVIRVMMQYRGLSKEEASKTKIPEQKLETPERKGFVAVEWGGSEIEN